MKYFKDKKLAYNLEDEQFMFDTKIGNAYFYATGFNKMRLLILKNNTLFLSSLNGKSKMPLDSYLMER